MNILLVVLAVILIWRVSAGMKRGVVRETIAFVNVIFAALVLGLVCMIFNAYHAENYLGIVLLMVGIVALSIIYSLLKIVFFSAKVVSKLPVVSSVDRLLGLVIGVAETLIIFWAMCCVFMYVDLGVLEEQIMMMVGNSELLTWLNQYNLLGVLLDTIKTKLY